MVIILFELCIQSPKDQFSGHHCFVCTWVLQINLILPKTHIYTMPMCMQLFVTPGALAGCVVVCAWQLRITKHIQHIACTYTSNIGIQRVVSNDCHCQKHRGTSHLRPIEIGGRDPVSQNSTQFEFVECNIQSILF